MKRNAPPAPIFLFLLELREISEEKTIAKFIAELKQQNLNIEKLLAMLLKDPPNLLCVILQRLSTMTGEGFQALVNEHLRKKLSNGERNSMANKLLTKKEQKQIWNELFTETAPATVNNLNHVAKKPVTKKTKNVAMATN